jgi:hypothetical protein
MANGSVARLPYTSEVTPAAPEPDAAIALGTAVADAVLAIAWAIDGYQRAGMLATDVKDAGARRIARIAALQLDHEAGDDDFICKARTAGKRVLRRSLTGDYAPHLADVAIDLHLDGLFTIVGHVVRDERTMRVAWAN